MPIAFRPRLELSLRLCLGLLAAGAMAAALGGCGVSTALGNDVLAPISALPETDVVFETNLQSAVEAGRAQVGVAGISTISSGAGVPETSGAPASTGEVSVANGTGVAVYTVYNPVDQHCLGTVVLSPGAPSVLGESLPGDYDFWFGPTTAQACTASVFTTEATVPSGWASGDPATRWPSP